MTDHIQQFQDQIDPARATAFMSTIGRPRDFAPGDVLPPYAHHLYFWDARPAENLGPDGHPAIGDFIPDLGFPRRMWAGGRLVFHNPLIAGEPALKTAEVVGAETKTGSNGPMALITIKNEIAQHGQTCVTEYQELVYLPQDFTRPPPNKSDRVADETRAVDFDPTLLFRYSALTFNGHRIHYDRDYATQVEGYAGLVVHGPLLAQLLMLWVSEDATLSQFEFRAMAPLMDHEPAQLCRAGGDYWITGPDGRMIMQARAET